MRIHCWCILNRLNGPVCRWSQWWRVDCKILSNVASIGGANRSNYDASSPMNLTICKSIGEAQVFIGEEDEAVRACLSWGSNQECIFKVTVPTTREDCFDDNNCLHWNMKHKHITSSYHQYLWGKGEGQEVILENMKSSISPKFPILLTRRKGGWEDKKCEGQEKRKSHSLKPVAANINCCGY